MAERITYPDTSVSVDFGQPTGPQADSSMSRRVNVRSIRYNQDTGIVNFSFGDDETLQVLCEGCEASTQVEISREVDLGDREEAATRQQALVMRAIQRKVGEMVRKKLAE